LGQGGRISQRPFICEHALSKADISNFRRPISHRKVKELSKCAWLSTCFKTVLLLPWGTVAFNICKKQVPRFFILWIDVFFFKRQTPVRYLPKRQCVNLGSQTKNELQPGRGLMRTLLQDLRYSFRQLIKLPGFTLTAVISLALGIGATTAVFSVVYAILLDPFPYRAPERLIHLALFTPKGFIGGWAYLTGSQWQTIRTSPVVEDSFLSGPQDMMITGAEFPENVSAVQMSSNAFQFLGVPPALGRNLQSSDAVDGHDPQPVTELGYKFWQRRFNADPAILGKAIQLDHKSYVIVGVAAPRLTWSDGDLYLPMKISSDQSRNYFTEVRLKPGISHAQADAALQPLFKQFAKETPKNFPTGNVRLHVMGINEDFVNQLGGTLYLLFSAVALLLAIGCGNVSILQLARATRRQQEFVVRSALGASRTRMVRQLLTESMLLSLTGAALGVLIAYKSLGAIVANLPQFSFPHEAAIRINLPVLLFSVTVALATGILFGLWPALQLSKPEISQMMQSGSRKVSMGVRGRRLHGLLIAGQIALTLLMMAGACAAIAGFLHLVRRPLGYDPHNVKRIGIPVHEGAYKTREERIAYFDALRSKIAGVPGITMTAISTNATPPNNGAETRFEILGKPSAQDQKVRLNFVNQDYFLLLHIPLAHGRIWDQDEDHRGALVAVINQTLARQYFPGQDPVGHGIKLPDLPAQTPPGFLAPGADGWLQIAGVIEDKVDDGLASPTLPEIFIPDTLFVPMWTQVLVRSEIPLPNLLHPVQAAVSSVNHDQLVSSYSQDLDAMIRREPEWARGHLLSWLFAAFAGLALALAAVGIYSVVSYTVAQRTNEFGIRIALGAQRSHVLRIVFRSVFASVVGGVLAGILLTLALNRVLASWAAESSSDPLLLLASAGVLALVAALACTVPARRAAGLDPMKAIRYE
jgi:predicted permease